MDCVDQSIKFILNNEYPFNKISFYAHNAGNFDAYLIIRNIIKISSCKYIEYLMDPYNSLFYLKFKYNDITFEFKDSYKIIPLGLNKLITDFNVFDTYKEKYLFV